MPPTPTLTIIQILRELLYVTLLSSSFGLTAYVLSCTLERKARFFTNWMAVMLGGFFFFLFISRQGLRSQSIMVAVWAIATALGAWFHRATRGNSITFLSAACTISLSLVVSFVTHSLIFFIEAVNQLDHPNAKPIIKSDFAIAVFLIGAVAYPVLFPMLWSFWQRSRPRPGREIPLPEAEQMV